MPHFYKMTLIGSAALIFGAGVAMASPKADLNNDKKIDHVEFMIHAGERFTQTDTNNDGRLSKEEIKAHRQHRKEQRKAARFDKIDTNNDGMISKAETTAHSEMRKQSREARKLEFMDINGDGVVSDAEKSEMRAKREAMRAERQSKRGDHPARIKPDADGDGFITRAEHDASTEAMFTRFDVNGDGVLTKGEGKRRKGKRGGRKHGNQR